MQQIFEANGGSIVGRDHVGRGSLLVGKNNQDAFAICQNKWRTVAIVCDGCSASSHSEVGAKIAAPYLAERLGVMGGIGDAVQCLVRYMAAICLEASCESHYFPMPKFIEDHFLFTVVGCVIDSDNTRIFSVGDGYWAIYGKDWFREQEIDKFPGNAPPYLGYSLLSESNAPQIVVRAEFATSMVESVVIGSDGVSDLLANEFTNVPGRDYFVGPISNFALHDEQFHGISRTLALINSQVVRVENGQLQIHRGLLKDDTTLVAIRRRKAAQ